MHEVCNIKCNISPSTKSILKPSWPWARGRRENQSVIAFTLPFHWNCYPLPSLSLYRSFPLLSLSLFYNKSIVMFALRSIARSLTCSKTPIKLLNSTKTIRPTTLLNNNNYFAHSFSTDNGERVLSEEAKAVVPMDETTDGKVQTSGKDTGKL